VPTKYVCIHGHFYQPPRENPWLDRVERQESAHPFHDWNERIDAECYRANARARLLDDRERVAAITNNYERISFNLGPTLLSWLEAHAPRTYADVLAADRASVRRFGRGSAMAQAYNHMILPLASERDRATQVRWGVRDFEHRYGRKPEGMWLPETAVCRASLRAMAREGIAFTVLAPRQAKTVRLAGELEHAPVHEGILDTRRPYRVDLGDGLSIAVFFYDGATSQAVAFERLLTNGDAFARRLLSAFSSSNEPELVHIATDGETYGHHHRFGEMALAYALDRIDERSDVELTNYAAYLAARPPVDEATIVERSAWSCAHGVGRWCDDCGCRMRGDSSQAWRKPLREALDGLREVLDALFESEGARVLRDPWAARDAYVDLILDRSTSQKEAFFRAHLCRPHDEGDRLRALELCELQRQRMLMYTSCGWFFDDVSGLETTQILLYAARATELGERIGGRPIAPGLLAKLDRARASSPGAPSARDVWERHIPSAHADLARLAGTTALASLFGEELAPAPAFEVDEREVHRAKLDDARFAAGRVEVTSRITGESRSFAWAVVHEGGSSVRGGLREGPFDDAALREPEQLVRAFEDDTREALAARLRERFPLAIDSLRVLPLDERIGVVERIVADAVRTAESAYRQVFADNASLLGELTATGIRPPRALAAASRVVLEGDLKRAVRRDPPDVRALARLLADARSEGIAFDETTFGFELGQALGRACTALERDPADEGLLLRTRDLVELARKLSHAFDLSRAQDLAWSALHDATAPLGAKVRASGRLDAWRGLARTLRLRVDAG
jgi:alpha-amylase/alpha-mannosidase (GH57 family)